VGGGAASSRSRTDVEVRALTNDDVDALTAFFASVPEGDRTFFKEDVDDREVIAKWTAPGDARSIAVEGDVVLGSVAVARLRGWSSHVGEVRVIVDPAHRGRGIGRALARAAILDALELKVRKLVVEVVAEEDSTIAMFRSLGFDPEALLTDHVRDHAGQLRDLLILAHAVDDSIRTMVTTGLADEV
jgi:L-amino acid N-acyltransferase YncA